MNWIQKTYPPLSRDLRQHYGDSLVLASQLADRGLFNQAQFDPFLDPKTFQQTSPFVFKDMHRCVERIQQAINNDELIGIWGDFDVDGQTSTALLVDGLQNFGARTCYHVPIRAQESHGIDLEGFKTFLSENQPKLIITCDTGISELESISYVVQTGIDVILTDHHKLPPQLPPALGIINPHLLTPGHPLSFLAGVGTAFQLLRAVEKAHPGHLDLDGYYDLVALGTVADLAEQKGENRFYTQMGLRQMNSDLRPSLRAILQIAATRGSKISETTIGITIAPRLNSAGRLGDANPNVGFLLSEDEESCIEIAKTLEALNAKRKLSVGNVLSSAQAIIERSPEITQKPVIMMHNPRWEGGVLGIAAGKLAQDFKRPVILMRNNGEFLSGSARSIEGIDITSAMEENRSWLANFGGHAMAGGLRLPLVNFSQFNAGMCATVGKWMQQIEPSALEIDHFISFSRVSQQLSRELATLAPFGPGNPQPLFASRNLNLIQSRNFGNNDLFQKITVKDINGDSREITCWEGIPNWPENDRMDIAYRLVPDTYHGKDKLTMELVNARPASKVEVCASDVIETQISISDFRNAVEPLQELHGIIEKFSNIKIWYEGLHPPKGVPVFHSRLDLPSTETLAILVAPANIQLLQQLLNSANPRNLFLFNFQQIELDVKTMLVETGKSLKHCLNSENSMLYVDKSASHLNTSSDAVRNALAWYQAHGDIAIRNTTEEYVVIERAESMKDKASLAGIQDILNKILKEQAAFKQYYQRVDTQLLLRRAK